MASSRKSRSREVEVPDEIEGGFVIGEEIGRGSFATVYRGWRKSKPEQQVAIKAVVRSKLTTKLFQNLQDEINILKRIRHGNVVGLVDCISSEHFIYLVMQFCSQGDLSIYIKHKGETGIKNPEALELKLRDKFMSESKWAHPKDGGLNEWIARSFVGQLADALSFLRSHSIIHRDIKPQNLLLHPSPPPHSYSPTASLSEDFAFGTPPPGVTYLAGTASQNIEGRFVPEGIPILRVADFGFARVLAPNAGLAETLCGSPLYMAPEILRYEKYDAKADLWSVGAVLYEMCVGKPPFRAQNHVELLRRIEKTEDKIVFPDEKPVREGDAPKDIHRVPDDVKALIRALLKRNPVERCSFQDFFSLAAEVANQGPLKRHRKPTQPTTIEDTRPRPPSTTSLPTPHASFLGRAPVVKPRPAPPIPAFGKGDQAAFLARALGPERPMGPSLTRQASDHERPRLQSKPSHHGSTPPRRRSSDKVAQQMNHSPSTNATMVYPGQNAPSPSALPSPGPLRHQPSFPAKYVPSPNNEVISNRQSEGVKTRDYATTVTNRNGFETVTTRKLSGLGGQVIKADDGSEEQLQKSGGSGEVQQTPKSGGEVFKEGSDDDNNLGREYVVVEKRAVELNALVDDLAQSPRKPMSITRRMSRGFMTRPTLPVNLSPRVTGSPSPPLPTPSSTGATMAPSNFFPPESRDSPSPPLYQHGNQTKSSPKTGIDASPRSYEAGKYMNTVGRPVSFPNSQFAKNILLANSKNFGPTSNEVISRHRLPHQRSPNQRVASLLDPVDVNLLADLETYAHKVLAVLQFADEKLAFLLPPTPANILPPTTPTTTTTTTGQQQVGAFLPQVHPSLMNRTLSSSGGEGAISNSTKIDNLAGEALILYVKALGFLDKAIRHGAEVAELRREHIGVTPPSPEVATAMEWMRCRFNEGLEKADISKSKAGDHFIDSGQVAEKLIYERALIKSRSAAVKELVGENAIECEFEYETALWLLYAILDPTTSNEEEESSEREDDGEIVKKFISSIKSRLFSLRRKMVGRN